MNPAWFQYLKHCSVIVSVLVLIQLDLIESRSLRTSRPGGPYGDIQARPALARGNRAIPSDNSEFFLERLTPDLWQINLPGDNTKSKVNLQTYQPLSYLDVFNKSVPSFGLTPLKRPKKHTKSFFKIPPKQKALPIANSNARISRRGTFRFRHHSRLRFQFYSVNSKQVMQLLPNGTVGVTHDSSDPNTILHIQPILMKPYTILLRTVSSGIYLCMDKKGRLYTSCNQSDECNFRSHVEKSYYTSLENGKYKKRYVSVSTNGKIRRSKKQKKLQQETYFMEVKLSAKVAEDIISKSYQNNNKMVQHCADYKEVVNFNNYVPNIPTTTQAPVTTIPRQRHRKTRKKCAFKNSLRCIRKNRRFRKCKTKKCRKRRRMRRRKKKHKKRKKTASSPTTTTTVSPPITDIAPINKYRYGYQLTTVQPLSYGQIGAESSNSVLTDHMTGFPKKPFDFPSSSQRNLLKDSYSPSSTVHVSTLPPPRHKPKRPFRDAPPLAVHKLRHGRRRKGHRRRILRGHRRTNVHNTRI